MTFVGSEEGAAVVAGELSGGTESTCGTTWASSQCVGGWGGGEWWAAAALVTKEHLFSKLGQRLLLQITKQLFVL